MKEKSYFLLRVVEDKEKVLSNSLVLCINRDEIDSLNAEFLPNDEDEIYIKHPIDPDVYISLNHYFDVILTEVIDELRYITECLDGINVQICLYEREKMYVDSDQAPQSQLVEVFEDDTYIEDFKKEKPYLRYFKKDEVMKQIIDDCLNLDDVNGYSHVIELGQFVIMKRHARNIDDLLEDIEREGNTSFTSGIEAFNRMYLTYYVEF